MVAHQLCLGNTINSVSTYCSLIKEWGSNKIPSAFGISAAWSIFMSIIWMSFTIYRAEDRLNAKWINQRPVRWLNLIFPPINRTVLGKNTKLNYCDFYDLFFDWLLYNDKDCFDVCSIYHANCHMMKNSYVSLKLVISYLILPLQILW